jgi:hypothetical protein
VDKLRAVNILAFNYPENPGIKGLTEVTNRKYDRVKIFNEGRAHGFINKGLS